ncbi:polyprenol monophosphomannose synthase [Rathayibacter tritici]|uniref:Glycosyl transferase n=1 Tax=Rathayibacter tritici TaxID=33888 RepID=A0A160KUT0_9MICO|nr:polyprenol monophosphomannose synthase [Rathayibacter tritici]AND17058.1 glycosyl transferase [Rathayibacter tritici]PPF31121.1 polyprenol monophosphomannose synthase [Rathayibacter tritici]PPF70734.1 polyprenol monophosphomannose synthase [Rathayibacter tritici]PPG08742.1 polyprenol monophosphomannose synthase [Rathayibacter tritici]PPI14956.1 polyprenol monophosphomannose synthase [Rathayibacter tritici]
MLSLTIVTPTYNEADNIGELLRRLATAAAAEPDVLVRSVIVDDSSPDGTADRARALGAELSTGTFSVEVLSRAAKEGLGAAYLWAFEQVLGREDPPTHILQMDADLSHDPAYLSDFLREVRAGADLVVASRYIPGGGTPDWTLDRKILSRGGNLYSRALLGSRLTDWTGGFNLFSRELLERIHFETVDATGYGFQIALKHRASVAARRVREIPIVFLDRTEGTSKIPGNTMLRSLLLVVRIRFTRDSSR